MAVDPPLPAAGPSFVTTERSWGPLAPAEVVLRFLESVGRRSEAEFYVELFRRVPKESFAAISVDANVARHATEAVVLHLRFLADLGLAPLVLLGLFETGEALEHGARIQRRLVRANVPATLFGPGAGDGLAAQVTAAARGGSLPVVVLGPADGAAAEDRFQRLSGLLAALHTRRLLFLHRPGGLRQKGALLPIVNLGTEADALLSSKELSRKERAILVQSRRLVADPGLPRLTVSITSPLNLLRELFTVKGAGTLLRRGSTILVRNGLAEVDVPRLRALLDGAFGRATGDGFFERPIDRIYLEEGYRGAALLNETPLGTYLTKFAVGREAQGEGLGRDLWDAFTSAHPVLFWRARSSNPIKKWYGKLADGLVKVGDWHVFWRGLPHERIPDAIAFAVAQPVDIAPPPT